MRHGPPRLLRRLVRVTIALCAGAVLLLALGFFWFVSVLPTEEIKLDRNADGIVALTGGASRIVDAMELMAVKRGQRLLISGANRSTNANEISRLHPEFATIVRCCVDFDRSLNTLGNAIETRKWAEQRNIRSLIVVTSGYHMPRAMAEIAHQLPGVTLIAVPGALREAAVGAVVVERGDRAPDPARVSEVPVLAGAHAAQSERGHPIEHRQAGDGRACRVV